MKLVYVSSVPTAAPWGGPLQIRRHFLEKRDFDFLDLSEETISVSLKSGNGILGRTWSRLQKSRLAPQLHGLSFCLKSWRNVARSMEARVRAAAPDAIVTVAYEEGAWAAASLAEQLRVPLITFFHDWWPDHVSRNPFARRYLDRQFRELYRASQLALCVSPELKAELGAHPNSHVLYPVPAFEKPVVKKETAAGPFRLVYLGAMLTFYGKLLQKLCDELLRNTVSFELKLYGGVDWPSQTVERLSQAGIYQGAPSLEQTSQVLGSADAFLNVMNFSGGSLRRVQTSFPSKLLEYAAYGKPLVAWGPEYSSAAGYLKSRAAGLVISDSDPCQLIEQIESLVRDKERQALLAAKALELARGEFDPELIQQQLVGHIRRCVDSCR